MGCIRVWFRRRSQCLRQLPLHCLGSLVVSLKDLLCIRPAFAKVAMCKAAKRGPSSQQRAAGRIYASCDRVLWVESSWLEYSVHRAPPSQNGAVKISGGMRRRTWTD